MQNAIADDKSAQKPTSKQRQFMDAYEPFVLLGGAMGSGKTQGLAFAATQHIDEARYRGLLVAHTDKQLAQAGGLYDILQNMFHDVRINRGTRQMRFPSGALLEFATLPDSIPTLWRQGPTYQFIGVDEAHNVLPAHLVWLSGLLRPASGASVPLRFRLTANPGGVAHDYLRSEYVDREPDGRFRFIDAADDDNPFTDALTDPRMAAFFQLGRRMLPSSNA